MAEFTRTKAFAALADALALPGTDSLRLVDISIATPVVDLTEIMRAGLADRWIFSQRIVHGAADTSDLVFDPWTAGAPWSARSKGTLAGAGASIPDTHEALILTLGGASDAGITDAIIYLQQNNLTTAPRPASVLFWADTVSPPEMLVNAAGPEYRRSMPLLLDSPTRSPNRLRVHVETPAAATVTMAVELLAAPRGVLSSR